MNFFRLGLVAAAAVLMTACASGPKLSEVKSSIPPLAADQGRIFFYRSSSMVGAAVQPSIYLNDQVVGTSVPGGFFYADAKAGNVSVATTTEVEKKLTFLLEPGQTRYVKTSVSFGLLAGRVQPELVDAATGEKELADTSFTGKAAAK
ncbi:MAG: DUF2846 domain-containing protein [Aquabacterium sp.]|jgi:hypothetical protein|nr:MAG: DUF2846 domain-containing protein [Aquabacterium sp.]